MNLKEVKSNWIDIKHLIKSKWEKFSDIELEELKGDLSLLSTKIQKVYGRAKDQAEKEFHDFKKSIAHLLNDDKIPPSSKK